MDIEEIKVQIRLLAQSVNENNAQGIASDLSEISHTISEQFNSPLFKREMEQFASVLTKEIEEADSENQKITAEVAKTKALLDEKENRIRRLNNP